MDILISFGKVNHKGIHLHALVLSLCHWNLTCIPNKLYSLHIFSEHGTSWEERKQARNQVPTRVKNRDAVELSSKTSWRSQTFQEAKKHCGLCDRHGIHKGIHSKPEKVQHVPVEFLTVLVKADNFQISSKKPVKTRSHGQDRGVYFRPRVIPRNRSIPPPPNSEEGEGENPRY